MRNRAQEQARIAVVTFAALGDSILAAPAVHALRSVFPRHKISVVTRPEMAEAHRELQTHDELLEVRGCRTRRFGRPRFVLDLLRDHRRWLGRARVDWAIIARPDGPVDYEALFCRMLRPRRLLAFARATCGGRSLDSGGLPGVSALIASEDGSHEVDRYFKIPQFFDPRLTLDRSRVRRPLKDAARQVAARTRLGGVGDEPIVVLGVGARAPCRRWPAEWFARLVDLVLDQIPCRFVICGAAEDVPIAAEVVRRTDRPEAIVDLTGRTSLGESLGIISVSDLFFGNCSGVKHLASIAGLRTIEVNLNPPGASPDHAFAAQRFQACFGPTTVLQPPGNREGCHGACASDEAHCILGVSVDAAVDCVVRALRAR
jgi:ADP-heptose:LPS heptosyltransferase